MVPVVILLAGILLILYRPFPFIHANYVGDSGLIEIGLSQTKSYAVTYVQFQELALSQLNFNQNIFDILNFINLVSVLAAAFLLSTQITEKYQTRLLFTALLVLAPLRIVYGYEWPAHANWTFILLYLYLLIKFFTQRNIRNSILLGVITAFVYYNHPYHAVMATVITIILLLAQYHYLYLKNKAHVISTIKQLVIWGTSALVLFIGNTYLWRLQSASRGGSAILFNNLSRNTTSIWAYSARPWQYFIPDINHPFLGDLAVKAHYWIWQHPPYYLTEPFFPKEHTLFLGYTLMALSGYLIIVNFIRKWQHSSKPGTKGPWDRLVALYKASGVLDGKLNLYFKFFLIIGLTAFIFSMPPYIAFAGIKFYFPSQFMYSVLPQLRAYARFGIFVFIANAAVAMISLQYILQKFHRHEENHWNKKQIGIFTIIVILTLFEFMRFPWQTGISTTPTLPYQWLATQSGDFTYMEIPARTDYTDRLYQSSHGKKIANPYLDITTPNSIHIMDQIIWQNSELPKYTWDKVFCQTAEDNNIGYFLYHEKDLNKFKVVQKFRQTGTVTPELKVALAESWGYPVWGNHVPLTSEDEAKNYIMDNMKELLSKDPKFIQVAYFSQQDIAEERPNSNFSGDKFDAVTVFQLNKSYCDGILGNLGSITNNE